MRFLSLKTKKNRIMSMLLAAIFAASVLTACGLSPASASPAGVPARAPGSWPQRPINMIVGYSAGGTTDIIARVLASAFEEYLGVPVTVVNITGATAALGGSATLEAPADGYTIAASPIHAPSVWAVSEFNRHFTTDFYYFQVGTGDYFIVVEKDHRWQTIEDLVDEIKENPGNFRYSHAGVGSLTHLAGELFIKALDLEGLQGIPYAGGREAGVRAMSGDVDFSYNTYSDIADLVLSGELRVLGMMTAHPVVIETETPYEAPSIPTIYPVLSATAELNSRWGLMIPRNTPSEIVKEIYNAFQWAMAQERFVDLITARVVDINIVVGHESDVNCLRIESLMAWGLYDTGLASKSPEEFDIPRIDDFQMPPHDRAENMQPWPDGI